MRVGKSIFLLLIFLFGASISFAQNNFTLKEMYERLEESNLQIGQSFIRESLAKEEIKEAKNNLLPTANLSLSNNYNYGLSFDQVAGQLISGNRWSHAANAGVSASIVVFDGFSSFYRIRHALMQSKNAGLETQILRRSLQLEVAAVFFDILANKELYKASQEHLKISLSDLDRERIQFETGLKTKVDLALAESKVAADETTVLISRNAYLSRLMDLKQLMNLPLKDSITLIVDNSRDISIYDNLTYDVEISPNVALAHLNQKQSKLELKMAKSAYYPQINLNSSYGTNYSSERTDPIDGGKMLFFDQLGQNRFLYVGASLSIPIFDAFKTRRSIRKANLNIQLREKELEEVQFTENKIWELAQQEYFKSLGEYRSQQASFKSVSASYDAMKERYEIGMATYFELSNILMEKNVAEFNLIKSKHTMLYSQEVIEIILNKATQ